MTNEASTIKKKILNIIKTMIGLNKKLQLKGAVVISRDGHNLSRKNISKNAIKVLYRLRKCGSHALLVGGCVRDLLLNREPKDFDVATNASPQEIRSIFRNGRMIGKRFMICHIVFKNEIVEVTTFRKALNDAHPEIRQSAHGMILEDNIYGNIDEDASRRDFSINALYYNIADFSIIDFHNGLADLKQGLLRVIGDPETRYREDPVRVLRAVRLATKLGFRIEKNSEAAIHTCKHLLAHISPARLFNEMIKIFMQGMALQQYKQLRHYGLLNFIFPLTEQLLNQKNFETVNQFLIQALQDSDTRIQENKTVTPAFLIAAFLWHPLLEKKREFEDSGFSPFEAFYNGVNELLKAQSQTVSIPSYFTATMRSIWELQLHLHNRKRQKLGQLIHHPRFRAGYDFLLLRSRIETELIPLATWWDEYYLASPEERVKMANKLKPKRRKKKKVKVEKHGS